MIERLLRAIPRRHRFAAGTLGLVVAAWVSMYGKLWCFEKFDAHRLTSKALLTGVWWMRGGVLHAGHDEQVHDGAVFTNWGFGVPLLQAPLHALASAAGILGGFFPDRAIFFLYLLPVLPVVWAALDRVLRMRRPSAPEGPRLAASWAAAWMVLAVALFPFMQTRFVVFEETMAYALMAQLLATAAWVFAHESPRLGPVVAMAAAAGTGLLVRPTGALYVALWGALVLLDDRRAWTERLRRTAVYGAVALPFVALWLASNAVRSGAPLGLGYVNSNPAWEYETPLLRFGATCNDTLWHSLEAAARLFNGFFFYTSRAPVDPWLKTCHFDLEERDGVRDPYFGPGTLVLLGGLVASLWRRRERRLAHYLPHLAMLWLFVAFVRRGEGFAWRYVGDFWPLVLLATLQHVLALPEAQLRPFDLRLARIMFWAGFVAFARFLCPWEWSTGGPEGKGRADVLSDEAVARLPETFREARYDRDPPLPSRVACGDPMAPIFHQGFGWRPGCAVATFTNLYLGVPAKAAGAYVLRLETQGFEAPEVPIYVNGLVTSARRSGAGYEASITLDRERMVSPSVMLTALWARGEVAPAGKLLAASLE